MPLAQSSFAHREVVAPVGLWERGAGASGYIPPSARVFPKPEIQPRRNWRVGPARKGALTACSLPSLVSEATTVARNAHPHRASKALATSPTGETPRPRSLAINGYARWSRLDKNSPDVETGSLPSWHLAEFPGLEVENFPSRTWPIIDRANGNFHSLDAKLANRPFGGPAI